MKVKWTLTETESRSIREAFEEIPTDLCAFVDCPEGCGDMCDCCPMRQISEAWSNLLDKTVHDEIIPLLREIEQIPQTVAKSSASPTSIGGQMVRKMIEAYEGK